MSPKAYELLALIFRYLFTGLGVIIAFSALLWQRRERRLRHARLSRLQDAGFIGQFTVLRGSDELPEGSVIPVPYESILGAVRTCDVIIPVDGVADTHADLSFVNGKGLYVHPRAPFTVEMDGREIRSHRDSRRFPMQHGSILVIGDAELQLGVFEGLDVKNAVFLPPEGGGSNENP